jgi:hypothetical protein
MADPADFDKFRDSMTRMALAMRPAMQKLGERFATAAKLLDKAMWTAYRQSGAIYGDTRDGRARWLEEMAKIQRLRAEADEIETWHASARALKAKMEDKA